MALTVTITKPNVFDQYGTRLAVGSQQSLPDDYAVSLIASGKATDPTGATGNGDYPPYAGVAFPSGNTSNLHGHAGEHALMARGNTAYIMGDSLAALNWSTVSNNFVSLNVEGAHEWANALAGRPLNIIGNVAVGGKTCAQMILEQIPVVIAAAPKYAIISIGHNDLYSEVVPAVTVYNRILTALNLLMAAGITPIWSTVWARSYDSLVLPRHLELNDSLRVLGQNRDVGIFWDGFSEMVDPTSTTCVNRPNWTYDSAPSIHTNNQGAYYLGKSLAAALRRLNPSINPFLAYGAEDRTNSVLTNLLSNTIFGGSGGTAGTGVSGTVPTGWTVDWVTRTGTGTAVASVVDVLDADSGLATAKGIQVVVSGTPAAGDEIRIHQSTGFNSLISGGDSIQAEGLCRIISPVSMSRARLRLFANNNESTWWGVNNQTVVDLPEGFTITQQTRPVVVLGSGASSQAAYEARFTFTAATGAATIVLSNPRVRKIR